MRRVLIPTRHCGSRGCQSGVDKAPRRWGRRPLIRFDRSGGRDHGDRRAAAHGCWSRRGVWRPPPPTPSPGVSTRVWRRSLHRGLTSPHLPDDGALADRALRASSCVPAARDSGCSSGTDAGPRRPRRVAFGIEFVPDLRRPRFHHGGARTLMVNYDALLRGDRFPPLPVDERLCRLKFAGFVGRRSGVVALVLSAESLDAFAVGAASGLRSCAFWCGLFWAVSTPRHQGSRAARRAGEKTLAFQWLLGALVAFLAAYLPFGGPAGCEVSACARDRLAPCSSAVCSSSSDVSSTVFMLMRTLPGDGPCAHRFAFLTQVSSETPWCRGAFFSASRYRRWIFRPRSVYLRQPASSGQRPAEAPPGEGALRAALRRSGGNPLGSRCRWRRDGASPGSGKKPAVYGVLQRGRASTRTRASLHAPSGAEDGPYFVEGPAFRVGHL